MVNKNTAKELTLMYALIFVVSACISCVIVLTFDAIRNKKDTANLSQDVSENSSYILSSKVIADNITYKLLPDRSKLK